jgi:AraC-like DNA-binding protein
MGSIKQGNKQQPQNVPLQFCTTLLVQARAFDKDVEAIIRAAGFPFNPLTDPDDTIPVSVEQYSRLCMELFEALGDESGGIIEGIQTPLGSTRMLAYSMMHCQHLHEAMNRAIEFNAVCREQKGSVREHRLALSEDRKVATLNYLSSVDEHNSASQHAVLCSMAVWMRVCSWMINKPITVIAAGCAGPAPHNKEGLQHFFPCPVVFEEGVNWLSFSAALLEVPIMRTEKELEAFLKVAPYYAVIKPVGNEQTTTARIQNIIGDDFRVELPTFEDLTASLNMSARTLRRRLDKEGTSYQRIKDGARRDAAITFLNNPALTVSDVAELVGFSDPSAFHRSFKRWTGVSPGEYR